jgi:hypothetical protein
MLDIKRIHPFAITSRDRKSAAPDGNQLKITHLFDGLSKVR